MSTVFSGMKLQVTLLLFRCLSGAGSRFLQVKPSPGLVVFTPLIFTNWDTMRSNFSVSTKKASPHSIDGLVMDSRDPALNLGR